MNDPNLYPILDHTFTAILVLFIIGLVLISAMPIRESKNDKNP